MFTNIVNKNFGRIKCIGVQTTISLSYKIVNGTIFKLFSNKNYNKYDDLVYKYIDKYLELFKDDIKNGSVDINFEVEIRHEPTPDHIMGYFADREEMSTGKKFKVLVINLANIKYHLNKNTIRIKRKDIKLLIEYVVLHEISHIVSMCNGYSTDDNLFHRDGFQKYFLKYRSNLATDEFRGNNISTNFSEINNNEYFIERIYL